NIGLLIVLGITSLGVYGVALSGWSSNSKYSLLGGLRASAQMISYEIALGLSLVGVLILAGTFSLRGIVDAQAGHFWGFIPNWFVFRVFVFLFVYIWVRGTLPRFRYDQLMAFGWKFLLPAAIANLVVTALVVALT